MGRIWESIKDFLRKRHIYRDEEYRDEHATTVIGGFHDLDDEDDQTVLSKRRRRDEVTQLGGPGIRGNDAITSLAPNIKEEMEVLLTQIGSLATANPNSFEDLNRQVIINSLRQEDKKKFFCRRYQIEEDEYDKQIDELLILPFATDKSDLQNRVIRATRNFCEWIRQKAKLASNN